MGDAVSRRTYGYQVSARPGFDSTWLTTTQNVSKISAPGDWRFDPAIMDFPAGHDGQTTDGLSWTFTAVKLSLDADSLARSGTAVGQVAYFQTAGKRESGAPVWTAGGRVEGTLGPVQLDVQADRCHTWASKPMSNMRSASSRTR